MYRSFWNILGQFILNLKHWIHSISYIESKIRYRLLQLHLFHIDYNFFPRWLGIFSLKIIIKWQMFCSWETFVGQQFEEIHCNKTFRKLLSMETSKNTLHTVIYFIPFQIELFEAPDGGGGRGSRWKGHPSLKSVTNNKSKSI